MAGNWPGLNRAETAIMVALFRCCAARRRGYRFPRVDRRRGGIAHLSAFADARPSLLSMIGFIMIGVVVNHSILLGLTQEAQLEAFARYGDPHGPQQRMRAILASTLTSALGALPMAVNQDPVA